MAQDLLIYEYRVTGQDAIQEIEKWAESAALASAAHSAHFSVSCMASCPVTLYYIYACFRILIVVFVNLRSVSLQTCERKEVEEGCWTRPMGRVLQDVKRE